MLVVAQVVSVWPGWPWHDLGSEHEQTGSLVVSGTERVALEN